ncbi:MAG TPA: LuxR C-terminal-related transcriptional regulator, partial [Verrucomicrobiae bacterium]|nr:LuxR C-terminal-related transcriptional regulator [Verrucomicrobiae bacterium]
LTARESDPAAAAERLTTALTEIERQGRKTEAIALRLDIGRVLSAFDRSAAAQQFSAAAADAREAGSMALQRLADHRLRELGVRTWGRGRASARKADPGGGSGNPLSEREFEVARLVIQGASNPEIAAQLYLSRKTVERHVSNALAKVGARNRTELAHRLREIYPSL